MVVFKFFSDKALVRFLFRIPFMVLNDRVVLGSSVIRSSLMSLVLGSSLGSSLLVFCYAILSERIIFGVFREKVLLNALGPWVVFSVLSPLFLLCYLLSVAPTTFCLNTSLATDFFYSFRRNVK